MKCKKYKEYKDGIVLYRYVFNIICFQFLEN